MTNRFGLSFQRFLRNFAAHSFGQVVNIVSQIGSVPLFLHYWTKIEYGEWIVLTSVPSLLWSLEGGLSGLASSRMTVASGAGDWTSANLIYRNVILIQSLLTILLLALFAVFTSTFDVSRAFNLIQLTPTQSGRVLMIMIGYMLLGFALSLLRAAYRASLLEARGIVVGNLWRLTDFLMIVLVLPLGGHPVTLACALTSSVAAWVILCYFDVRRQCPKVEFSIWPVSAPQLRVMFKDALPVFAAQGASAIFLQGYPLVVNRIFGPATVVTFTTIRTASRTLLQLVQMVSFSSGPEFSRAFGRKDWEAYLRLLKVLVAVTVWTGVGAGLLLALAGPWAIGVWTSGKVTVGIGLMSLFAISVACQCGWNACGSMLFSTNMHHAFNYVYLGLTVAGLLAADLLGIFAPHLLGFYAIPLVMVTVDATLLFWALYLSYSKLTFVPISALACVFQPYFYLQKLRALLKPAV